MKARNPHALFYRQTLKHQLDFMRSHRRLVTTGSDAARSDFAALGSAGEASRPSRGRVSTKLQHCTLSASDAPLEWLLTPAVIDTGLDRKTLAGLLRSALGLAAESANGNFSF
jgi:hypothetical protein